MPTSTRETIARTSRAGATNPNNGDNDPSTQGAADGSSPDSWERPEGRAPELEIQFYEDASRAGAGEEEEHGGNDTDPNILRSSDAGSVAESIYTTPQREDDDEFSHTVEESYAPSAYYPPGGLDDAPSVDRSNPDEDSITDGGSIASSAASDVLDDQVHGAAADELEHMVRLTDGHCRVRSSVTDPSTGRKIPVFCGYKAYTCRRQKHEQKQSLGGRGPTGAYFRLESRKGGVLDGRISAQEPLSLADHTEQIRYHRREQAASELQRRRARELTTGLGAATPQTSNRGTGNPPVSVPASPRTRVAFSDNDVEWSPSSAPAGAPGVAREPAEEIEFHRLSLSQSDPEDDEEIVDDWWYGVTLRGVPNTIVRTRDGADRYVMEQDDSRNYFVACQFETKAMGYAWLEESQRLRREAKAQRAAQKAAQKKDLPTWRPGPSQTGPRVPVVPQNIPPQRPTPRPTPGRRPPPPPVVPRVVPHAPPVEIWGITMKDGSRQVTDVKEERQHFVITLGGVLTAVFNNWPEATAWREAVNREMLLVDDGEEKKSEDDAVLDQRVEGSHGSLGFGQEDSSTGDNVFDIPLTNLSELQRKMIPPGMSKRDSCLMYGAVADVWACPEQGGNLSMELDHYDTMAESFQNWAEANQEREGHGRMRFKKTTQNKALIKAMKSPKELEALLIDFEKHWQAEVSAQNSAWTTTLSQCGYKMSYISLWLRQGLLPRLVELCHRMHRDMLYAAQRKGLEFITIPWAIGPARQVLEGHAKKVAFWRNHASHVSTFLCNVYVFYKKTESLGYLTQERAQTVVLNIASHSYERALVDRSETQGQDEVETETTKTANVAKPCPHCERGRMVHDYAAVPTACPVAQVPKQIVRNAFKGKQNLSLKKAIGVYKKRVKADPDGSKTDIFKKVMEEAS